MIEYNYTLESKLKKAMTNLVNRVEQAAKVRNSLQEALSKANGRLKKMSKELDQLTTNKQAQQT